MKKSKIVIAGGGTAGITCAARLVKHFGANNVTVIDPAENHYYQPFWTLVGGGVSTIEETRRSMSSVIPAGVIWEKDGVKTFDPEKNLINLESGTSIEYEYLVVATGIQLDFDQIEGLKGNLGKNGICSNYQMDIAPKTWEAIQNIKAGDTAVFTFPANPFKCAGAPQKIMWLAEETFREKGIRDQVNVTYVCAAGGIFGIKKYKEALEVLVKERNINVLYNRNLVGVDADKKVLKARNSETKEIEEIKFDMLHITPPQSAPDFIKTSPLSTLAGTDGAKAGPVAAGGNPGYVNVDKFTTQHVKYKNVFSIGDVSSLPNSKTGAAIRKQAPVMTKNLIALSEGREMVNKYDGYASCPLVVDRSHVILAEFGYDGVIMETFPFDQGKPRRSMYILKKNILPTLYWQGMLKGRA